MPSRETVGSRIIPSSEIEIDPEEVLRLQGKRKRHGIDGVIQNALDEGIALSANLIEGRASCRVIPIRLNSGNILIDEKHGFHSQGLARRIAGATHILLGLCTIGDALEAKVRELFDAGRYARAMMLDAIGSVAVENAAEQLERSVRREIMENREGFKTTRRFSPGYSDWTLEDQKVLFDVMRGCNPGIALTDSCLMIPRKSISFVCGVGSAVAERTTGDSRNCANCPETVCAYNTAAKESEN